MHEEIHDSGKDQGEDNTVHKTDGTDLSAEHHNVRFGSKDHETMEDTADENSQNTADDRQAYIFTKHVSGHFHIVETEHL